MLFEGAYAALHRRDAPLHTACAHAAVAAHAGDVSFGFRDA